MIVQTIKTICVVVYTAKEAIAKKAGRVFVKGEATMHLCYGCAVLTELHEGFTIYAGASLGLGIFAVLVAFLGE